MHFRQRKRGPHYIDTISQEDDPRNVENAADTNRKKIKREENTPAETGVAAAAIQYANTQDLLISQEPPTYATDATRALELSPREQKSGSYTPLSLAPSYSECGAQRQPEAFKENEIPRPQGEKSLRAYTVT